MLSLVLGTAFFVGIHLFISGTTLRDKLVGSLGEKPYLGLFSLMSLGGIVWMCSAYASAPTLVWWQEPPGARWLVLAATLVAFIGVVIGMTSKNPTATGGEGVLDSDEPGTGILRITRHPFLWCVALWASVHLLVNGDAASVVLFAGLVVLTVAGTFSIDAKRARKFGGKWENFAKATSNLPFAAIAQGRNRLALGEIAWWKWLVGVGLWAGMIAAHAPLFGERPLPF